MINVSQEFLEQITKPSRRFEMQIEVGGTTIYAEDVIDWTIESQYSNSSLLGIGGVVSAKLNLSVIRSSRVPEFIAGQNIKVWVGLEVPSTSQPVWVQVGLFHPDIASATKTDQVIKIDCYDILTSLEEKKTKVTRRYPCKAVDFIEALKTETGINIDTTGFAGTVGEAYEDGTTVRAMLSEVSELSGGNIYVDNTGVIRLNKLKATPIILTASNYIEFTLMSDSIITMDGIICGSKKKGAGANFSLSFENKDADTEEAMQDIWSNTGFPLSYYAYELSLQGMPHITVGDKIRLIDKKGINRELVILTHTLKYNGGLISEFGAEVPQNETTETGSDGSTSVTENTAQQQGNEDDGIQYGLEEHMVAGANPVLWDLDKKGFTSNYNKKDFQVVRRPKNTVGYNQSVTTVGDFNRQESYQLLDESAADERSINYRLQIGHRGSDGTEYHNYYDIENIVSPLNAGNADYNSNHYTLCVHEDTLYIMTCSVFRARIKKHGGGYRIVGSALICKVARFNLESKAFIRSDMLMNSFSNNGALDYLRFEVDIMHHKFFSYHSVPTKIIFYVQHYDEISDNTYLDLYMIDAVYNSPDAIVFPQPHRFPFHNSNCGTNLMASESYIALLVTFPDSDLVDTEEMYGGYTIFELDKDSLVTQSKFIRHFTSDEDYDFGEPYDIEASQMYFTRDTNELYVIETIRYDGRSEQRIMMYDIGYGIDVYYKSKDIDIPLTQYNNMNSLFVVDSWNNLVMVSENFYVDKMAYVIYKNSKKGEQLTGEYYKSECKTNNVYDNFISYVEFNPESNEFYMINTSDLHDFKTPPTQRKFIAGYPATKACKLYWAYDTRVLYMYIMNAFIPIKRGSKKFPIHPRLPLPRNHPEAGGQTETPVRPPISEDIWTK